jgi:hypothetical protein
MAASQGLVGLVAGSVARFPGLVASGTLRQRRDWVGELYRIEERGTYRVFRETVSDDGTSEESVVLVVGFQLRLLGSVQLLHWLFQRACLLTTPFWSGFRGFRVKLWMVDPTSERYLGIYEWAGAGHARTYVEALVRVLRPLSTPGSVWYELVPDQELEAFLRARHERSALPGNDRRPVSELGEAGDRSSSARPSSSVRPPAS